MMYIWNRYTQLLAEYPHQFPAYEMNAIMMGRPKWKPLELPLSKKKKKKEKVSQKQYLIPRGTSEINNSKNLKGTEVVIPTHLRSTCLSGLCRRQLDLGE